MSTGTVWSHLATRHLVPPGPCLVRPWAVSSSALCNCCCLCPCSPPQTSAAPVPPVPSYHQDSSTMTVVLARHHQGHWVVPATTQSPVVGGTPTTSQSAQATDQGSRAVLWPQRAAQPCRCGCPAGRCSFLVCRTTAMQAQSYRRLLPVRS